MHSRSKMYANSKLKAKRAEIAVIEIFPEGIQPCNMKNTFIKEDTRYMKHYREDNDASAPFKLRTLEPYRVLPVAISCPVVFS